MEFFRCFGDLGISSGDLRRPVGGRRGGISHCLGGGGVPNLLRGSVPDLLNGGGLGVSDLLNGGGITHLGLGVGHMLNGRLGVSDLLNGLGVGDRLSYSDRGVGDGYSACWGLTVDDGVESIDRVSGVGDRSDGAVWLN